VVAIIELRVIDFRYLSIITAWAVRSRWFGQVAMFVTAPSEWVIDNQPIEPPNHTLFSMYPLGTTRESAMRHGAFIYGNVVTKDETLPPSRQSSSFIIATLKLTLPNMVATAKIECLERSSEGTNESCFAERRSMRGTRGPNTLSISRDRRVVLLLVLLARADEEKELRQNLEWVGQHCDLVNIDQLPPGVLSQRDTRPPQRLSAPS